MPPPVYEWVYFYVATIADRRGSRGGRTAGLFTYESATKTQEHIAARDALEIELAAKFDTEVKHVEVNVFSPLRDQI